MEHAARQNSNYLFCRVFIDLWGWPLLFEITSLLSTTLDWFMKLIRCDTTNQNQEEQLVRKRPSAIFLWVWCWLHLTRIKEDSHLHVYHCDNILDYSSSALDFITAVSCDKTALKNIYSRVKTKKKPDTFCNKRFQIYNNELNWSLILIADKNPACNNEACAYFKS